MPEAHRRKVCSEMSYKSDDDDKRFNLDWVEFPENILVGPDLEPDVDNIDDLDLQWNDDKDRRADDLLVISRLESNVRTLRQKADAQIERNVKQNDKPLPLWLKVLLHNPDSKKWVLIYHVVFVSLMIFSVFLFIWAMGLIF